MRQGNQHGNRHTQINRSGDEPAPEDGAGKNLARLLNLITHDRGQIQALQAIADRTEDGDELPRRAVRIEIVPLHRGPLAMERPGTQQADQNAAAYRADASGVRHPFSCLLSTYI